MKTTPHLLTLMLLGLAPMRTVAVDAKESSPAEKSAAHVEPSEAFRAFVERMDITGVSISYVSDAPTRILVNKRVVRLGELVERELEVRFVAVNPDAKILVFEDKTGARLTKSFGPGN